MSKPAGRKIRGLDGIAVYQRGKTWYYRVDLEPDQLTGKRRRENKGGFASEKEALTAALKAKADDKAGRRVKPSRQKVHQFAAEWLRSIEHSVKPTTFTNYQDYLNAYVLPTIGERPLQDITVTVLNTFYRHLLDQGRRKPNTNAAMYEHWRLRQASGKQVTPRDLSAACKTTIYAAQAAIRRYKAGRLPRELSAGLAPKTVRNIQNMMHAIFGAAVAWRRLEFNPADHVSRPRVRRYRPATWNAEQLAVFLRVASGDRFRAMWMLVATTGMRRSELAGAERRLLDLEAGTLTIEPTRVVVAGQAVDEDGKTESGRRTISLDPHTVNVLREHLKMLDMEQKEWGDSYPDHGKLFCFEDGRLLHPDTITRTFNRLVDRAGLQRINLHGVRHSYATVSIDAGINPKTISERIGHASVAFTMQTYVQRSRDVSRDARAACEIASLITTNIHAT